MALVTSAQLKGVASGGLIHEDVMDKIWDISKIPLPLTDMIGSDTSDNSYTEWTEDSLQAPDITNAAIDGADAGTDDNNQGKRVGNHHQISTKYVTVSNRARKSKTIGRSDELAYQVIMRQRELRRDVEAIMLTQQASFADTGAAAGKSAGLGAWLESNTDRGATGADGGFSAGIVAAATNGTTRTLTETLIRDMTESVYNNGGDSSIAMTIPKLIRKISEYLFTSSARVATLQSDIRGSGEKATAMGAVNVLVTDFGTLELIPNRLMHITNSGAGTEATELYLLDPMYIRQTFLSGYTTDEMAKTGLADKRLMHVDWSLKVLNEKAQAIIADIDYQNAVTL